MKDIRIVTFKTTTMALMMERACREEGASGRLIPLPRQIDAGCGMCWAAPPGEEVRLCELMQRRRIVWDRIVPAHF